jgi:putative Mg2+ transporter-C (MgtC) family protein
MNFHADIEILYRLLISFGIGTAIGMEREYRSKAAGLRTMIMICLGSTIFTQISIGLGGPGNPDRIASTIVSGIGFLGAGVIFKDGMSITGITTATTIWIAAALGMAVGAGEYFTALIGGIVVLIVLIIFEKLQNIFESLRQTRIYRISFADDADFEKTIALQLNMLHLGFRRKRDFKTEKHYVVVYEIFGSETRLNQFNDYLKTDTKIQAFEY